MAAGADIGIADAIFSGIKAHTSRRPVVKQIPVMLLSRDTQNPGVNIGEVLQVRRCLLERYGAELRAAQAARQEFARDIKIVDRKPREKPVLNVDNSRKTGVAVNFQV